MLGFWNLIFQKNRNDKNSIKLHDYHDYKKNYNKIYEGIIEYISDY